MARGSVKACCPHAPRTENSYCFPLWLSVSLRQDFYARLLLYLLGHVASGPASSPWIWQRQVKASGHLQDKSGQGAHLHERAGGRKRVSSCSTCASGTYPPDF